MWESDISGKPEIVDFTKFLDRFDYTRSCAFTDSGALPVVLSIRKFRWLGAPSISVLLSIRELSETHVPPTTPHPME